RSPCSRGAGARAVLFPTRPENAIALELSALGRTPPARTSTPGRPQRIPHQLPSRLSPGVPTFAPGRFRRQARQPLLPRHWLHKESQCLGQTPGVLEPDLPTKREGLNPWPSSEGEESKTKW